MMKEIRSILPATNIKCCRFDLCQAWWRKIQNLGLPNEYKDSANFKIGKWLTAYVGLAFLPKIDMDNIRLQVTTIVSTQLNNTRHTVSVDSFRLPK
jgi:hypothetical protein